MAQVQVFVSVRFEDKEYPIYTYYKSDEHVLALKERILESLIHSYYPQFDFVRRRYGWITIKEDRVEIKQDNLPKGNILFAEIAIPKRRKNFSL